MVYKTSQNSGAVAALGRKTSKAGELHALLTFVSPSPLTVPLQLRASTRARLIANLRNAAQGLAGLEAQKRKEDHEGGAQRASSPLLLPGDSGEARAVCAALEQCLFHRIRTKDFRGVMPFWAFLERVERLPITMKGGAKPGARERRLSSVRNTVGAVASCRKVSTPVGRARSWIRQCLVCKCLKACVAAILAETRLVQVFYEPTALARCDEGSTILLRLCAALESFDIAVDADQLELNTAPSWPILHEEEDWDRRMEAAAAAPQATSNPGARPIYTATDSGSTSSRPLHTATQGSGGDNARPIYTASGGEHSSSRPVYSATGSAGSDAGQQEFREGDVGSEKGVGKWVAAASSEMDKLSHGENWSKVDNVIASISSKVDQAVQSLDGTLAELFGDRDIFGDGQEGGHLDHVPYSGTLGHTATNSPFTASPAGASSGGGTTTSRKIVGDGWVEIRGDPHHSGSSSADARYRQSLHGSSHQGASAAAFAGGDAGLGREGRRGKARVFGVPLEELVLSPERCSRGVLEPALGVPDAILNLIEALSEPGCYNTPGIFVEEASETELLKVVKSLEKGNQVPPSSSALPAWLVSRLKGDDDSGADAAGKGSRKGKAVPPHALASALLFFLHRLPEPLLTFRRREAFLSCEVIPDVQARVRNVKLLVEDLPWAHKPLFIALIDLLATMTSSSISANDGHESLTVAGVTIVDETDLFDSSAQSGVTIRDAAESLAPALLRPPKKNRGRGGAVGITNEGAEGDEIGVGWEEELAATSVVELILSERNLVLEGLRAEQAAKEEKLTRKVKRLTQLQRMLAAKVFLDRRAHLAVVISIWRRLEKAERELLCEADHGRNDAAALGLATLPAPTKSEDRGLWKEACITGGDARQPSPSFKDGVVQKVEETDTPMDVDRDVRELEDMFLGVGGADDDWKGEKGENSQTSPSRETADVNAPDSASDRNGLEDDSNKRSVAESEIKGVAKDERHGGNKASDNDAGDELQQAFSIEDDPEETGSAGATSRTPEKPLVNGKSLEHGEESFDAKDFEDTEKLLDTIAATLTPEAPRTNEGDHSDDAHRFFVTKSELALVNLMEEAAQESGDFPADQSAGKAELEFGSKERDASDEKPGIQGVARKNSGFEGLLLEGATGYGSMSSSRGKGGDGDVMPSNYGGNDGVIHVGNKDVRHLAHERRRSGSWSWKPSDVVDTERHSELTSRGSAAAPRALEHGITPSSLADMDNDEVVTPAATGGQDWDRPETRRAKESKSGVDHEEEPTRGPEATAVFSLGHERWVRCGFNSGFVVDKAGPTSSVSMALRGAGSVLALDSVNYFLWRYPQSATSAVLSFARRRHAGSFARDYGGGRVVSPAAGGDAYPFPIHAGHLTHLIADLLTLSPPATPEHVLSKAHSDGVSDAGARGGKEDGSEPSDVVALRLARLEAWKLLDSPHAFQEMFSCAVLVMEEESTQRGGIRSYHPQLYQESILETRRVLRTCLQHVPDSVDSFWAAATVEGGISLDPGDILPPSPMSDGGVKEGVEDEKRGSTARDSSGSSKQESASEELMRVLGLSALDVKEGELGEHKRSTSGGQHQETASSMHESLRRLSTDDRLTRGESHDGDAAHSLAISSDWLLGGETARAGLIENIANENSSSSGPTIFDGEGFKTRLLCPSQILSGEHARALAGHLPDTVLSCDWVCLFSDNRHGTSLHTLLARCAGWEPTIVVIEASLAVADSFVQDGDKEDTEGTGKLDGNSPTMPNDAGTSDAVIRDEDVSGTGDKDDRPHDGPPEVSYDNERNASRSSGGTSKRQKKAIFGGFASGSRWRNMGRGFAGDGRSFLFTFDDSANEMGTQRTEEGNETQHAFSKRVGYQSATTGSDKNPPLKAYRWSGSDRYFMTSDEGVGFGMGGGGRSGTFGFFVENDLRRGSTGACDTFENDPLILPSVVVDDGSKTRANRSLGVTFEVESIEVWGFRHARCSRDEISTRVSL